MFKKIFEKLNEDLTKSSLPRKNSLNSLYTYLKIKLAYENF